MEVPEIVQNIVGANNIATAAAIILALRRTCRRLYEQLRTHEQIGHANGWIPVTYESGPIAIKVVRCNGRNICISDVTYHGKSLAGGADNMVVLSVRPGWQKFALSVAEYSSVIRLLGLRDFLGGYFTNDGAISDVVADVVYVNFYRVSANGEHLYSCRDNDSIPYYYDYRVMYSRKNIGSFRNVVRLRRIGEPG